MSSITCYRVRVPEGRRLSGFTTAGQRVPILPGEYLAHRVEPKVPWLAAGHAAIRGGRRPRSRRSRPPA